jgi:hypothetical protein
MEGEQQIRCGQAKGQRGEDGEGNGCVLRQGETDGRAHEGSSTGSGHDHSQHPGEKAAGIAMARGQAGPSIGYGQPDLKHARQRKP